MPSWALSVCACLALVPEIRGGSIDTLSSWTGASVHTFGDVAGQNPGGTTFGQTFRIHGTDALLQSLTFVVEGYAPYAAPEACTFEAAILGWNGSRATGPTLYKSSPMTMPLGFFPTVTFTLPLNVNVSKETQYVVVFTSNDFLNGIRSDAAMYSVSDSYSDGSFVSQTGASSFDDLINQNWDAVSPSFADLAIRLEYTAIPEPSTALLAVLGVLLAAGYLKWQTIERRLARTAR
jgi:hypothetical protein